MSRDAPSLPAPDAMPSARASGQRRAVRAGTPRLSTQRDDLESRRATQAPIDVGLVPTPPPRQVVAGFPHPHAAPAALND